MIIDIVLIITIGMIATALVFSHIVCYHHGKYKAYTHALGMFEEFGNKFKEIVEHEENEKN